MAKVISTEKRYISFNEHAGVLEKGKITDAKSELALKYPESFIPYDEGKVVTDKKVEKKAPKKVEEVVVTEEPKEELLVEAPVEALVVTEEEIAIETEEKPSKRRGKKK